MDNIFCSRGTAVSDTSDISSSGEGEAWGTPSGSGSSGEIPTSGFRGTKSWHTYNASGDRETEVLERECEDTDPRKMTAEGSRHTSDTSQQPSACGDPTSNMKKMFEMMEEMYKKTKGMFEIIREMDDKKMKEILKIMKEMDNKIISLNEIVHTRLQPLNHDNRAFPGRAIQIQHQEKEENEMLKNTIKKLEKANQELLAKAMDMHQYSEDINDPSRLSAVLKGYEMLRLREWEKVRCSMPSRWTYEEGSRTIRKLFDACEKEIQQRTDDLVKVLGIPTRNNALTEVMMPGIRKLLRQNNLQNLPMVHKIVQEAAIYVGTENERQFLLQCCQIYCLLLLQDPPVKAEWKMNKKYLEHVDNEDVVNWKKTSLLWPIMKHGEDVIVKGVVWSHSVSKGLTALTAPADTMHY